MEYGKKYPERSYLGINRHVEYGAGYIRQIYSESFNNYSKPEIGASASLVNMSKFQL